MKKLFILILAATTIIACGNTNKPATTAQGDSTNTTTLGQNEQSEDHYAIWQMDSTNEVNFTTYDLAAMEAKGHVKKIEWADHKLIAEFDEQGNITSLSDDCGNFNIDHNNDGCLTSWAPGAGSVTYSIDPETDLLTCFSGAEGALSWTNWYKYDKHGNLQEIEYNQEDQAEETTQTDTEKVTILSKDDHNNWTKIKIGKRLITRKITYYPNPLCDEEQPAVTNTDFKPMTKGYSFAGTIGTDENCILTFVGGKGTYIVGVGQRKVEVESYDAATGKFTLRAYMKSTGEPIGHFAGTYKNGTYKGEFTNSKGGKVTFNLKMQ